jgi:succinylglutamate desuccinylase/aspartoacylase family protein
LVRGPLTRTIAFVTPVPSILPAPDSAIDPVALAARFEAAGRAAGFRRESFGAVAGCPLVAFTKRTPGPRPRIYLSAGIHGDEPAPPLALLEMLEAGVFDARAVWFLCPLLNPVGLARGIRENADTLDLNRDYKDLRSAEIRAHVAWLRRQPRFDVAFCLHEDWEATGFYLYELNPDRRPTLAEPMLAAVAPHCPIDPATVIDGRPIDVPGIIRPVSDPLMRENWPEAIYLRAHHTTLTYTVETPSALPLPQRIAAHRAAIETALRLTCPSSS